MRDFCGYGVCSFYNVISSTLMPMEDLLFLRLFLPFVAKCSSTKEVYEKIHAPAEAVKNIRSAAGKISSSCFSP